MLSAYNLYGILLIAVPVLGSLTLHEYGHARVALAFGDGTARRNGRITLNPLAHLDPLGTICFLFGPVGWARPVPVDPTNLRPARTADVAVSLAGVGMNLLLILLAGAGLIVMSFAGVAVSTARSASATPAGIGAFMLAFTMQINCCLIVFNLIPLYPLDGHHVLREMLPARHHAAFSEWQHRFGRWALLGLILLPWLARRLGAGLRFDPIGWLLGFMVWDVMPTVLPADAAALAHDAWVQYAPFLTYPAT